VDVERVALRGGRQVVALTYPRERVSDGADAERELERRLEAASPRLEVRVA
jgi:hypothetical protein